MKKTTILILNHNGLEFTSNGSSLFKECLDAAFAAARKNDNVDKIILIDNASTDSSVEYAKETFPEIEIYQLKTNYFLFGYNYAVKDRVRTESFVCLNNDMVIDKDFFKSVLDGLDYKNVIAVKGCAIDIADKITSIYGSNAGFTTTLSKKNGIFVWKPIHISSEIDKSHARVYTFLAAAGTAYSTEHFLRLGGFSETLFPFYWEDFDLSYRIWKSGYQVALNKNALYYTTPNSSLRKKYPRLSQRVFIRNKYLASYINITQKGYYFHLLKEYILRLLYSLKYFRLQELLGLLWIIPKLPEAFMERKQRRTNKILSDKEVFETVKRFIGQKIEVGYK